MEHRNSTSTEFSNDHGEHSTQIVASADPGSSRAELLHEDRSIDGGTRYSLYPNKWAHIRQYIREPAAEFLGTMILIIFGNGVNCQVTLSANAGVSATQKGSYLSVSFGWAVGVALGVWMSGGISGGHINPSVTLSMAIFRGFPWRKVPIYMAAQVMGALCGAGIIYANYSHAIDIFEGGKGIRTVPGTASLFATYSLDYMTPLSCFFNEFVGTAMLLIVILAATDRGNMGPPPCLLPLVLFVLVLGIGACLGMQTGYAINPARDFGPRLMTAMVGYGRAVFTYRNQYWIWSPIVATFLGGIAGTLIYDSLLFVGAESIINKPNSLKQPKRSARDQVPAGVDVV